MTRESLAKSGLDKRSVTWYDDWARLVSPLRGPASAVRDAGGKRPRKRSFFLPFFGVNVRGFSRFISGPFQGQNPVTPRVFSRSRQTQNCKLDIIPLFPRRQSTAHNGGQIIGPTTQAAAPDKPHQNVPYLPLNATKPLLFCCVRFVQV